MSSDNLLNGFKNITSVILEIWRNIELLPWYTFNINFLTYSLGHFKYSHKLLQNIFRHFC